MLHIVSCVSAVSHNYICNLTRRMPKLSRSLCTEAKQDVSVEVVQETVSKGHDDD